MNKMMALSILTLMPLLGASAQILNPAASNDFYITVQGTVLAVPAPGVLTNDTVGTGTTLTAVLVSSPTHGVLNLTNNGGFTYTPQADFTGIESFTYLANDGVANSAPATVTISAAPPGGLFFDDFSRNTNADPLAPWVPVVGTWTITGGQLQGTDPVVGTYNTAYVPGNWTNFGVQALLQFPADAFGGGLIGRLDPVSGASYAVNVYPNGFPGESTSPEMKLLKFHGWGDLGANPMQTVILPVVVGTSPHTLQLIFQGSRIMAYFDGALAMDVTDNGFDGLPVYTSGGISTHFYEHTSPYVMTFDNVLVSTLPATPVAANDSYSLIENRTLTVAAPGVLSNDVTGAGTNLIAVLVTGPTNGTVNLSTNGGFSYQPTTNYMGTDSFTYEAVDSVSNSTPALVTITVASNSIPIANNDSYVYVQNTTLTVAAPGVLANDTDADEDSLTAGLVSAPTSGTLNLSPDGGFTYTPATNFNGTDSFTYVANDGSAPSIVATVTLANPAFGAFFYDNFTRSADPGPLTPWVAHSGNWTVTGGALQGGTDPLGSYASAYLTNTWSDYSVEGRFQFSAGAYGGSLGGRLNPVTGTRYAAWIYPSGNLLNLIKYEGWENASYPGDFLVAFLPMPAIGTNWHTLKLAFKGNQIAVYYDGGLMASVTDAVNPYPSGGVSMDMYTDTTPYLMSVDDVIVKPLVVAESYKVQENATLEVPAPGLLGNDTGVYGNNLTATLVSSPTNGTLYLTNNGGFSYTPSNNYAGPDSFTYQANDGPTNLGTATVTITITGGSRPALIVTAQASAKTYDGTTGSATPPTLSGTLAPGDIATLTQTYDTKNVGTGKTLTPAVTITNSANNNVTADYAITYVNRTAGVINQTNITVTATANTKTYDGTTSATATPTVTLGAIQTGDTANFSETYDTMDVGTGKTLTPAGSVNDGNGGSNYSYTYVSVATGVINSATLTVAVNGITANNKVYDGTTAATIRTNGYTLTGVAAGDAGNVILATNGYTATFASTGANNGMAVTVSGLTLTGSAANKYTLTQPTGLKANITAKALTITGLSAQNKIYDGLTNATLSGTAALSGVVGSDVVSLTGTAAGAFVTKTVGTGKTVNVTGLSLTGGGAGNYSLNPLALTANITVKALTITGLSALNKVYDGLTNATLSGTAALVGVVGSDVVSLTGTGVGAFVTKTAGTGKTVNVTGLSLTGGDAGNYSLTPLALTANITPLALTVSGITASNKVYDATTVATVNTGSAALPPGNIGFMYLSHTNTTSAFASYITAESYQVRSNCLALAAIVNSGAALTPTNFSGNGLSWQRILTTNFSTLTSPTCGLTVYAAMSNNVSALGRGTVRFSANQTGCNIYICELTNVWFANGALGAIVQASARAANSSVNPSNVLSALASGGQDAVVAFFVGASNPFNATPPTGWTEDTDMGYNGPSTGLGAYYRLRTTNNILVLTRSASAWASAMMELRSLNDGSRQGPLGGDNVTLVTAGATGTFASAGAGSGKTVQIAGLTLSGADASNYTLTEPTTTANITLARLTVTATETNKVYGSTLSFAGTEYRLTGTLFDGDTLTNVSLASGGAAATATVGNYPIVPTAAQGTGLNNYTISYTNGALTVGPKAAAVAANPKSKTYGEANPGLDAAVTGTVNGDTLSYTLATTAVQFSPVAGYPITLTLGVNSNYNVTATGSTLAVGPKAATVAANPKSKTYGETNPGLDAAVTGTVNGDTLSYTLATTAVQFSPVAGYPITVTLGINPNYSVTASGSTLTVGPKAATVAANPKSKTYGEANPALDAAVTGTVNGDRLNYTLATTAVQFSPVAGYPITVTLRSNPNYNVSKTDSLLTVGAAALTVVATDATRACGQTNPVFTATYIGFLNGETNNVLIGTLVLMCSAETNSPVGTYAIEPSGVTAANYSITFTNGTLTVLPYALTVTADDQTKTYGQTDPAFTVSYSGFVNGENESVLGGQLEFSRAPGEAVGDYAIIPSGLSSTNYAITYVNRTLTIGPATLTITASNDSKTYGQTKSYGAGQTAFTSSGLQNGETIGSVTITADGGTAATAGVGSYTLTPSSATGGTFTSRNYSITYHYSTLTVNALAVSLSGSRVYDGTATAAASILSVANLVGSDVVTLASGSATLASANVGQQAIASVGTLALGGPAAGNYTLAGANGSVTITASDSSLTVGASANPSLAGSNVTFTATVTPDAPASTTPTGNVQFYTNGVAVGGPVALSGGMASLSTAELPVGTNIVGAAYLGDGNYRVSSNSLAQVVRVNVQKPTTVGIKRNGDRSVTISFSGTPGVQYIVQAKSDLARATAWVNVSTNIPGTDGQWTFTDSTTNHPIHFYRAKAP